MKRKSVEGNEPVPLPRPLKRANQNSSSPRSTLPLPAESKKRPPTKRKHRDEEEQVEHGEEVKRGSGKKGKSVAQDQENEHKAKRQKPKVEHTAQTFAFWQQEHVFDSCERFTYHPGPVDVQLVIDNACEQCKQLGIKMTALAKKGVVLLQVTAPPPISSATDSDSNTDADTSESKSDSSSNSNRPGRKRKNTTTNTTRQIKKRAKKRTKREVKHRCHLIRVFDEEFQGYSEFYGRFAPKVKTPLPHQTQFACIYSKRSEEAQAAMAAVPATAAVCSLGSGKSFLILYSTIGPHRAVPAPDVYIVCPKSVLADWSNEVVNIRPNGPCQVTMMAPAYFNKATAGETRSVGILPNAIRQGVLVIDESQVFKNETESKLLDLAMIRAARELYLLSGTPIPRKQDIESFFDMLRVPLKDSKGRFRDLQDVHDELVAKKQIFFYDPSLTNPAWFKEHFPEVIYSTEEIPLSWTQLARCLLADGRLLLGIGDNKTRFADSIRNSYHTRSRMFCASVETKSGKIISPKIDFCVKHISSHPDDKNGVYSNYKELGIHAVRRGIEAAGIKSVVIDGDKSSQNRAAALAAYNGGKIKQILYSNAAGMGINLMGTNTLLVLGVEPQKALQQQAQGRVARYHSHGPGGKVRVIQCVASLPDPKRDPPTDVDLEGLVELWAELMREKDGLKAKRDAKQYFIPCILESLVVAEMTTTCEQDLLESHIQDDKETKPIRDMLMLAGTFTADAPRATLRSGLGFTKETSHDADAPLSEADIKTFANICRKYGGHDNFEFLIGRKLPAS